MERKLINTTDPSDWVIFREVGPGEFQYVDQYSSIHKYTLFKSWKEIENTFSKTYREDKIENSTNFCTHSWIQYIGLKKVEIYCLICGEVKQ